MQQLLHWDRIEENGLVLKQVALELYLYQHPPVRETGTGTMLKRLESKVNIVVNGCWLLTALTLLSGCGIHYYDAKTGTEHFWGCGHLKAKTYGTNGSTVSVRGWS